MEYVRDDIDSFADLDYQRFFCLNCFLWRKEMHILAGNCVGSWNLQHRKSSRVDEDNLQRW